MTNIYDSAVEGIADLSPTSTSDALLSTMSRLDLLKTAVKELDREFKDGMIVWLKANGGELDTGKTKYYVKKEKKVELREEWKGNPGRVLIEVMVRSPGEASTFYQFLDEAMTYFSGDLESVAKSLETLVEESSRQVLSTGAFKPAATKKVLGGEKWGEFWKEEEVEVVDEKTGGKKAKESVGVVDEWSRGRGGKV